MKLSSKDEILRMYDITMMQYTGFLAKLTDREYKERYCSNRVASQEEAWTLFRETTIKGYQAKLEVLRIILGFNGDTEGSLNSTIEAQHEEER